MKKYLVFFAVLLCFVCMGCSSFTEITYGIVSVTENPIGNKVGQIDRLEGGILEAAKNGGITRISTVSLQNTDKYTTYYWPMLLGGSPTTINTYHKAEIIVSGE